MQQFDFHGSQITIIPNITAVNIKIAKNKTWYQCEVNDQQKRFVHHFCQALFFDDS